MIRHEPLYKGKFIDRPNRFVVHADLDGETITCHMPNPGRLWELLFPGVVLWIRRAANPGRKTLYDVVGVERDNTPVLMDTQYNNDVAAMFPDAVTERGRKHILHLVSLQEKGYRTGILFLVQWRKATWFLPDYHTDPDFADTFAAYQDKLD